MNTEICSIDHQRERWQRHRAEQAMTPDVGDQFACGQLGGLVDGLDFRVLFLPSDPAGDAISLDQEVLNWLKQQRESPYGGGYPSWGYLDRATNGALIQYQPFRDDKAWSRYLALHRHGGLEVGIGHFAYEFRPYLQEDGGTRIFPLRPMVGLIWTLAALQADVVNRWQISGPFEITIALSRTRKATLGTFAEGWPEPGQGLFDFTTCLDENVLLRHESDKLPEPEQLAVDLGDRLEQVFGTVHRRHLARRGEFEGRFDPRFHAL
jgi:hypothetical protein